MRKHYNRGLIFELKKGTELHSNVEGVVEFSGESKNSPYHSSYGNIVVIKDLDGSKHLFAHLDKVLVEKGEHVIRGFKIGEIGDTGRSDVFCLHYEVSKDGIIVDANDYPFEQM